MREISAQRLFFWVMTDMIPGSGIIKSVMFVAVMSEAA